MLRQEERIICSIVAAAAPNVNRGEPFDRDRFVSAIMNILIAPRLHSSEVNVLLLGAWGCGAFGCDPKVVAACFIEVLRSPASRLWEEIHFAIPADHLNANIFAEALGRAFPQITRRTIP